MRMDDLVAEIRADIAADVAEIKRVAIERECWDCGDTESLKEWLFIIAGHTYCMHCRRDAIVEAKRDADLERKEAGWE